MAEGVVIAFEVVEIEHQDGEGTALAASEVEFAIEELLHVATVVEAGEGVADGLDAERFAQVEVGNGDRDVFGGGGGELEAAGKDVGAVDWVRSGEQRIIILDGEGSESVAIGDERDTNRRPLAEQVRATGSGGSAGMGMGAAAAQSPTLFGGEDAIGGTDTPFDDGIDAISGGAEEGDGAGGAGEQTAQAFGDEAKDFFAGSADLKQATEFADLGNFGGLATGMVEQVSDLGVGGGELFLRGLAAGDFLLLVELGEGEAQGKGEERGGDRHVRENLSVRLFPAVHHPTDSAEHGHEDEVDAEEAEEICGFGNGIGLAGRGPCEGQEPSGGIRKGPAEVEPGGGGEIVVAVDPVPEEGGDGADQEEES